MTPAQKEMIRAIAKRALDARRALETAFVDDRVGPDAISAANESFEAIRNEANLLLASTLPDLSLRNRSSQQEVEQGLERRMDAKRQPVTRTIGTMRVEVRKDHYSGLWNIYYCAGGTKWAGPYKTKREAIERLREHEEREKEK